MERDSRRDQGEWRGCHNFDKIICDGDAPTTPERRGGLKMGETYYYYYELNGSTETYNHSLPTTTTCPFLPGQTVNKLDVPMERRMRLKSASMNSLRNTDYQTMDPVDRFTAPRPPHAPGSRKEKRTPSASPALHKQAAPSISSPSGWSNTARRFLGLKHRDGERGRKSTLTEVENVSEDNETSDDSRSVTPSGSVRSRDLSPDSLRRFLSDSLSSSLPDSKPEASIVFDDGDDSDNDDDDNFANSSILESTSFTTLSPPPFQRGGLSAPPASHLKTPSPASMVSTPTALTNLSLNLGQFSFYDDSGDEDDSTAPPTKLQMAAPITGYSLPQSPTTNKAFELQSHFASFGIDCSEP